MSKTEKARAEAEAQAAEVAAERRAAFDTMRLDRRWMTAWLITVTMLSIGGNVGSAVLGLGPGSTRMAGIGWAAVPPILLWWAVEGMPTLERMLAESGKDRILTLTTWAVVCGAFGWSAHGIYTFTVAVGTPPNLAWLAPLTIDLSIFSATRGLVKTAPAWARMKAGAALPSAETEPRTAPRPPAQPTRLAPSETATRDARNGVNRQNAEAATTNRTVNRDVERDFPPRTATNSATAPAGSPPRPASVPATATPGIREVAARVHAARVARKLGVDDIANILAADAAGAAPNRIAADTGVHRDVVAKVITAARELVEPTDHLSDRELVAATR